MTIRSNPLSYTDQKYGEFLKQIVPLVKKDSLFSFENIYKNNIADKSQMRYLKYILGRKINTLQI